MSVLDFDVFIVGGGLVGCALAQALRHSSLKIGMSDVVSPDVKIQQEYDARALAMAYRSHLILKQLELWENLSPYAAIVKHVHVSEKGKLGMTRVDAEKEGVPALGYVLEMPNLNRVFLEALKKIKNLTGFVPCDVRSMQRDENGITLFLQHQDNQVQTVRTRLLVIASGARSTLRDALGITTQQYEYGQNALVVNVGLDKSLQDWAYERFTPNGPIACLPLRKQSATMVWTVKSSQITEVFAAPDKIFQADLQKTFGYRAGNITWIGKRQTYPLHLQVANEQIRDRIVIMGNAAHNLHPVGAQGFNLSLRDVMRLAQTIQEAFQTGEDFSSFPVLEKYLNQSLADQNRMIQYTHYLVKCFSNENLGLSFLRSSALSSLDFLPPLKSFIAEHNMGF
jgi:2-octaprenyl-6-methoxyphenol hydroxylase